MNRSRDLKHRKDGLRSSRRSNKKTQLNLSASGENIKNKSDESVSAPKVLCQCFVCLQCLEAQNAHSSSN